MAVWQAENIWILGGFEKNKKNKKKFEKVLDEIPINVYYNEVLCGNDLHKALKIWLIGQVVKTSPSHGEDRGSTPL